MLKFILMFRSIFITFFKIFKRRYYAIVYQFYNLDNHSKILKLCTHFQYD